MGSGMSKVVVVIVGVALGVDDVGRNRRGGSYVRSG
jgi:hypothetical protein